MNRPVFRGPWEITAVAKPTPDGIGTIWTFEWRRWLASGFCRWGPSIPAKRVDGKVAPA